MYQIFAQLCSMAGVTPYKVGKETGIATSTLSDWKSGKSSPKQDKLKKIAEFFGVSVEYLMTGETKEFSLEVADEDTKLIFANSELKKCFLKILDLPKDKQDKIISLIDMI